LYTNKWATLPGSQFDLPVTGKSFDVTLTFDVLSTGNHTAQKDSTLRLLVRSNKDGSQATVIGYDASTQQLFVDRTNSGDVNFDPVFPGIYSAALIPDAHGRVSLRVLVDWSLVEVFGGQGETVITAQIFPSDDNQAISLSYTADAFKNMSIKVKNVASVWK
jgi:sucrose-6-phosphate hydrolase SacC (GH32 family)